jgi:hypothetical protein
MLHFDPGFVPTYQLQLLEFADQKGLLTELESEGSKLIDLDARQTIPYRITIYVRGFDQEFGWYSRV